MTQTRHLSPLSHAPFAAACALLAVLLLSAPQARAQWTQPDASGNINNTNTGNVGVGTTTPETGLHVSTTSTAAARGITNEQRSNDGNSSVFTFRKSRAGAALQNGDNIGNVFGAGSDGTSFIGPARLRFTVDGAVSTGSVPVSMQFFTGSTGSGTERMRITSAGNVGIGTSAPSRLLELSASSANTQVYMASTAALSIFNTDATANNTADLTFRTFDAGGTAITPVKVTAVFTNRTAGASSGDLTFVTLNASVGAERMRVTGAGNVGIGTSAPAHRLDVSGNVNASGLCLGGECKTAWSQVGGTSQWITSGSNVYFNGGNVGIGTASPVTRLHVGGQADNLFQVVSTGTAATDTVANFSNAAGSIMIIRGNGNIGIGPGITSPSETLMVNGKVSINRAPSPGPAEFRIYNGGSIAEWSFRQAGSTSHNLNISKSASGVYTDYLTIDLAGNLGVGTTAPASKLFVGSGTAAVQTLPGLNVALGGNSYVSASNGTVNTFLGSDTSAYGIVGTLSNHPLGLRANNTLAMTITPAGNVGVGNTTPSQKLDVSGNVNASGLCLAGECKTAWSQVGGGTSQWTTNGGNIHFSTGNVGIGTSSPNERLGVQGMVGLYPVTWTLPNSRGLFMFHGGGGGSIYAYNYLNGTPDPITISAATVDFNTYVGGTPNQRMFIANDGNVGIGTNAPASLLNLVGANAGLTFGTAGASDSSAFSVAVTASGTNTNSGHGRGLTVKAGDSDNTAGKVGGSLTLNPGSPVAPANAYGNVLMATSGGNVGIGTSTPSQRLDVSGNVNASGLCLGGECKTAWSQVGGGTSQWTTNGSNIYFNSGNVGVGTSSPAAKLHVAGSGRVEGTGRVYLGANAAQGARGLEFIEENATTFAIRHHDPNVAWQNIVINPYAGNVGIGTLAPRGRLEVAGGALFLGDMGNAQWGNVIVRGRVFSANSNIHLSPPGGGGVYINSDFREAGGATGSVSLHVSGDVNAGGNISAKYQDVAEWVPSTQKLAAGTVVILDEGRTNHVVASGSAYDTKVAGVVSARPGVILGEGGEGKLMVATTGRVRVRVDATRGPIKVGDLLVTSDKEGVAMKSVAVELGGVAMHRPGTIIGKALEPLAKGTGEILVLLSLQ